MITGIDSFKKWFKGFEKCAPHSRYFSDELGA